ncbi:MAG: ATP-binding protein [Treponema sp.]|nr:ATP-binding protein [Treponema sp.]
MQEIGIIFLILIVLILLAALLIRNRIIKKSLEDLVKKKTDELELKDSIIKELEDEALTSSRAKSTFLTNMSHELRTPLNVVIALTDLIMEEENLSEGTIENLHKINGAGKSLLKIINDVLDFSKTEAGKLILMPAEYHTAGLLNDVITLMNTQIGDKPITFNLEISDDLPAKLYGDDLRIKQIINNLLGNALKNTSSGSIGLSVKPVLGTKQHGHNGKDMQLHITVSDTGVGISEENLRTIFEDQFQSDDPASPKTSRIGLGLSITRRLVEMMDGEVSAESEVGKGSVFRARIKQRMVDSVPIGSIVTENLRKFRYNDDKRIVTKKLVRPDLSFARVLVVDDMQTNLDVASGLLGKYKMQVECVLNGREAYERMRKGSNTGNPVYNAIFLDHMMPGMDGIETADLIRGLGTDYALKIPIIALTANAARGNEDLYYAHGFQAFIPKPIDIILLDSVVRKWIKPSAIDAEDSAHE